MTLKDSYRYKLDLQMFADGLIDFDEDNTDGAAPDDGADEDDDASDALDMSDYEDIADPEDGEESPDEKPDDKPAPDPEPTPDPEEEKKKQQTAEENARFAEDRRQRQLQAELDKAKESDPAFQLAKELSDLYGVPTDQLLQQIRNQKLADESKKTGVPVEHLKRQQEQEDRTKQLETKLAEMEFKGWSNRMDTEGEKIKAEYPMLTDTEITQARLHMLQGLQRTDMALEEVVFALHGKKIASSLKELAKQEALAEVSGRTKGPLPPSGGKPSTTPNLTDEEKYVAKLMGMSEADYLKYKP